MAVGFFERRWMACKTFAKGVWDHLTSLKTWVSAATTIGVIAGAAYVGKNYFGMDGGFLNNIADSFGLNSGDIGTIASRGLFMVGVGSVVTAIAKTTFDVRRECLEREQGHNHAPAPQTPQLSQARAPEQFPNYDLGPSAPRTPVVHQPNRQPNQPTMNP